MPYLEKTVTFSRSLSACGTDGATCWPVSAASSLTITDPGQCGEEKRSRSAARPANCAPPAQRMTRSSPPPSFPLRRRGFRLRLVRLVARSWPRSRPIPSHSTLPQPVPQQLRQPVHLPSTERRSTTSGPPLQVVRLTGVFAMNSRHRLWWVFVDEVRALLRDYFLPVVQLIRWIRRRSK